MNSDTLTACVARSSTTMELTLQDKQEHKDDFKYRQLSNIRHTLVDNQIKGLRPVLEGFVVTMHEGACETGSQIPRALARGI